MSITISGDGDINATGNDIELNSTGTTDVTLALGGGSVGVGVASPTATLDVNGTIKLDGNYPVGTRNVALGDTALDSITSGAFNNIAIGDAALTALTDGDNNVAVGRSALISATTAQANTSIGHETLVSLTTGGFNAAIGAMALNSNTTASNLTAVGYQAGYSNTTGTNSVYIGHQSGDAVTTANSNTFVGRASGGQTTTGGANTFIGEGSGGGNVTGAGNTFLGHDSGSTVTGSNNTILGKFNGNQNGLDIRTSNNSIVLSDGAGNPRSYYTNRWHFFSDAPSTNAMLLANTSSTTPYILNMAFTGATPNNTTSEFLSCGDPSFFRLFIYSNGNVVNRNNSYGAISDEKLKENIVDSGSQWDDIKALRVRKYSMKEQASAVPTQLGVIAQEVEAAGMGGLVFESPDKQNEGEIVKQVNYSVLYMKAVKALQEAMERIETLEAKVTALENA